jgi:carbonic anhydrase
MKRGWTKSLLLVSMLGMPALAFSGQAVSDPHGSAAREPGSPSAQEALARLESGNERYSSGQPQHPRQDSKRRAELATRQHPFAVVLGCADSRTSPEVLFDQGLGDLFVIRVAGNVVDDHVLASMEYAVEHLGTPLIVVLGHERCGAVKAAVETAASKGRAPGHIASLVAAIQPAVGAVPPGDAEEACRRNIANVVQAVRTSEPMLHPLIASGQVQVTGAYYDLDTGRVSFRE